MTAITIRNVPEEVRAELAARAERSGRSLQEYLLGELSHLATRLDPADWLAAVAREAREGGAVLRVDTILDDRDADRR
ncbi:hypothetical protein GCM10009836_30570 [Pseudonocardia ailaonensis]|uniref:Antitoxin FitA-like ribbon-helix-helix domain-containing protein n=1 Tax=Pseudonocardia ailaonensis TaxID=367279 RepID=A0ABN2N346_9PSEU